MTECIFPVERLRSGNILLTQGLFYEYKHQTTGEKTAVYTLREQDHGKCLSMYRIYMDAGSEYEAAQRLVGSWSHWRKICNCSWFKPYIASWRDEVLIREASIGKATIIEQALDGNVTAAKELLGQVTKKKGPGRPSNKVVESEKSALKRVDEKVVSLLTRMQDV